MQAPVIRLALSDARNATISPTGSGHPNLPIGRWVSMKFSTTFSGFSFWNLSQLPPGCSIDPGAILFTKTPSFAKEIAVFFVAQIRAAFAGI